MNNIIKALHPTLDRVVVKKCDFDKIVNTDIIISSQAKNDINKHIYEVIEAGPGGIINGHEVKMFVKAGDLVMLPEFIGSEINIQNETYRIVNQSEIIAIVDKEDDEQ